MQEELYRTLRFSFFILCYFQSLQQLHFNNIFALKYPRSFQYQYHMNPFFPPVLLSTVTAVGRKIAVTLFWFAAPC